MAEADTFEVRSFCKICHTNCGILVTRDGAGNVLAVRGDPDHPRSHGYMCPKGVQTVWAHNRPDRLDHPLLGGQRTDWNTFLDDLAGRIGKAIERHGPDAIGSYGATGCDDLGHGAVTNLVAALGSTSRYTAATVDIAPEWKAAELVTGYNVGLTPNYDADDEDVRLFLLVGTNPLVSHSSGFTDGARNLRKFRARGGRLWVFDPARTRTAAIADEHIAAMPGTDPAILAWLARELLDGLAPDSPVLESTRSEDRARLREALEPFTLDRVARYAGVEPAQLERLLADIRSAGRLAIETGTGSRFQRHGVDCEWLSWVILILTDSLEKPGGMWFSPGWQMPVEKRQWSRGPEGGADAPEVASRPDLRRNFNEVPCAAMADEIEAGRLKVMIINGGNPLTAFPEPERLKKALQSLDALVVLDVVTTPLTDIASHVVACTGRLERAEYNPIQSARPQFTEAVVSPGGERKDAWWVIGQLGKRLGVGDKVLGGIDPDEATIEKLYEKAMGNARNSFAELKEAGPHGLFYSRRGKPWARELALDDGMWRIAPEVLVKRLPDLLDTATSGEYPMMLVSGRQERRMNTVDSVENRKKADQPLIHVSPADAARYGLVDGGRATLRNTNGRVSSTVKVDERMREGALTLAHGWKDANVTRLTSSHGIDPLHGQPQMTAIPVAVEPA